jgi:hypothetical protein
VCGHVLEGATRLRQFASIFTARYTPDVLALNLQVACRCPSEYTHAPRLFAIGEGAQLCVCLVPLPLQWTTSEPLERPAWRP